MLRRLGIGAHRLFTPQHGEALLHGLRNGVRVIDTAPNYAHGASERLVGSTVSAWLQESGCSREDLVIMTKVGLIQGPDLADAKAREAAGRPWPGVVKLSPEAWFCIGSEFVEHSIRASTARLGMRPDIVLLHNPEFVLAHQLARHGHSSGVDVDGFYDGALVEAFAALAACHEGHIGVSANFVGCRYSVSGRANDGVEALDLHRVVQSAARANAGARCRVAMLPLNLLEPDATLSTVDAASATAQAQALGFRVVAHRPIHAIPPAEDLAPGFGVQRGTQHLCLRDAKPTLPTAALVRQAARAALTPYVDDAAQLALEDIALSFAAHAPHVDVLLNGTRTVAHVDRVVGLLRERAPLTPAAHDALAAAMRDLVEELTVQRTSRGGRHQQLGINSRDGRVKQAQIAMPRQSSTAQQRTARGGPITVAHRSLSGGSETANPADHVELPATASEALRPSADGGPLAAIGTGDRGAGLVYRAGRLAIDFAAAASARSRERAVRPERWLVKVQAPLDLSGDAEGGMGRMTPTTLLLHDEVGDYCAFVREEEAGHSRLLRCALRSRGQVAYLWAEDVPDDSGRLARVRIYTSPVSLDDAW